MRKVNSTRRSIPLCHSCSSSPCATSLCALRTRAAPWGRTAQTAPTEARSGATQSFPPTLRRPLTMRTSRTSVRSLSRTNSNRSSRALLDWKISCPLSTVLRKTCSVSMNSRHPQIKTFASSSLRMREKSRSKTAAPLSMLCRAKVCRARKMFLSESPSH